MSYTLPIGKLLVNTHRSFPERARKRTLPHMKKREVRRLRLTELIEARCAGRQATVTDRTGIAETLVSRYVTGAKGIGEEQAEKIERCFGLPRDWLARPFTPDDASRPADQPNLTILDYLFELRAAAQRQPDTARRAVADALGDFIREADAENAVAIADVLRRLLEPSRETRLSRGPPLAFVAPGETRKRARR